MIKKDNEIIDLKNIFSEYKENYNPIINEYTKIYTYTVDNKIVAFLIFMIMYEKCEIIDVFVSKEYRNNQIAQLLINEIIKDYNIENITLEVSNKNIPAINLYKKLGFKEVANRKNYYEDSDGILMLKEIR